MLSRSLLGYINRCFVIQDVIKCWYYQRRWNYGSAGTLLSNLSPVQSFERGSWCLNFWTTNFQDWGEGIASLRSVKLALSSLEQRGVQVKSLWNVVKEPYIDVCPNHIQIISVVINKHDDMAAQWKTLCKRRLVIWHDHSKRYTKDVRVQAINFGQNYVCEWNCAVVERLSLTSPLEGKGLAIRLFPVIFILCF